MTVVWELPRESIEWVGPITTVVEVEGQPIDLDPGQLKFAVVPRYERPSDEDWQDPYLDPEPTGELGILSQVVDRAGYWGIWVKVNDNPEVPVLAPDQVGWLRRT